MSRLEHAVILLASALLLVACGSTPKPAENFDPPAPTSFSRETANADGATPAQ